MDKVILLICILLFPLVTFQLSAQEISPAFDEPAFFEELEDIFDASKDAKKAKEFLSHFEIFWHDSNTSSELKSLVIRTANKLSQKGARPFPDYYLYLTTIESFVAHNQYNQSFTNWHRAIDDLLVQPRYPLRDLCQLLETTLGVLSENLISNKKGISWYSSGPGYRFEYQDTLKLIYDTTKLVCHSRGDSIVIYDANGTFLPETGVWQGREGKINWEQSGFDPDRVYAVMGPYTINLNNSYFEAPEALFYNLHYFSDPLKGTVEHKVMSIRTPENSTYPRFESSGDLISIDNIHPGIHYRGGFCQRGAKILGSGTDQNPATITVFRNDSLFISARSQTFALRSQEILSNNTEIKMYLDSGFIYHPGLIFKYMTETNELNLIRDGEGLSQSPFFDTHHNVSIDSEIIKWNLATDSMELRMLRGAAQNHAFFESLSYYRESFYNFLQGMDAIHPLQGLKNCSEALHSQSFTTVDYAHYLNLPESHLRPEILKLSFFGFVGYNTNNDSIEIRERLNDYLLFRKGQKDYDVIRFKSLTPGSVANAVLNLKNNNLSLNGVEAISICDHQNVVFFPKDQKVTLTYNRDFKFDGEIKAGMVDLFGNGFYFSYNNFRIDMARIDSMRMRVMTGEMDYSGQPVLKTIKNTIADLSGSLQIDTANNKSGKKEYPQYPILVSNRNSFIYYNRAEVQEGAYKSDAFYFEATPFEMDSISHLNESNIAFEGTLVSNILPDLTDQLIVREDYSLGFEKQSPPEGYPLYDNKARFTNIIDLSNHGLQGKGTLEYLTSKSQSQSFTFLPNETRGQAHQFDIEPQTTGTEYPDVQGKYIQVSYRPQAEELQARSQEEPFSLYNRESKLEGALYLTPTLLKAKGQLNMPNANLLSSKMELFNHALMADSSDFNLVGQDMAKGMSFKTTNLISQIDFQERQGRFSSHGQGSKVEFTENQYLSFINEFSWNMDKNDIYMGARGSRGNRFVSTNPRQDSLEFYAPLARYDAETKVIEASEVKNIQVADANILLSNGIVKIQSHAQMVPLDSAVIELRDSTHTFHNAMVTITGKNQYDAFGEYEFINENQQKETIDFHKIGVNKAGVTSAKGTISEKQQFIFNDHFTYKGDVAFTAGDSLLTFSGTTQMLYSNERKGPQAFIRFEGQVDPFQVRIPIIKETQNEAYENLYHDIFLTQDSSHIYSAFLEGRKDYNDVPIISANGYLTYNTALHTFDLADSGKLANPTSPGPLLRYHEKDCYVSGEGPLDLGITLDPIMLKTVGTIKHFRDEDRIAISALFGADFFLDPKSTQMMADAIRESGAPEANPDTTVLSNRLRECTSPDMASRILKSLNSNAETIDELPPENQHTLCFTDLEIGWDTPSKSYMTEGSAQLGWIKNNLITRQVDVKMKITRSRAGNTFELYLEADPSTWFFFSYENGKMQTRSSLDAYNTHVQGLETDQRKEKSKFYEKSYVFILSPESRMTRFMQKFENPETPLPQEEELPEGQDANETQEAN